MTTAFRSAIAHLLDDPGSARTPSCVEIHEDGLLVVDDGRVTEVGAAASLLGALPVDAEVVDWRGRLIVPGFVDTHVHYPQTDAIASYGEQLLDWLERYVYPVELEFGDAEHAARMADFFLDELLRNGTTSALVMATVHAVSAEAVLRAARARNMRLIAGKTLMDRNCPGALRETPEEGYAESRALIEAWHGCGRLSYAVTPRFAPTSSEAQLESAARLLGQYPGLYLHSHLAENAAEVDWVARLFPGSRSYLDVYDRFGLVRPRSVFAHCVHLDDTDRRRMAEAGAAAAFCPTSNLFLGSGLFDVDAARRHGMGVGVGSDVGAGTSFSMLRTLSAAYQVAQLQGQTLSPYRALYLATLGGARALCLDRWIGNLASGKDADFVVLDPAATALLERRVERATDWLERLFAILMLGDDRCVAATYIMGDPAYRR